MKCSAFWDFNGNDPVGVILESGWGGVLIWRHVLRIEAGWCAHGNPLYYSVYFHVWLETSIIFLKVPLLRYNLNATWLESKLIFFSSVASYSFLCSRLTTEFSFSVFLCAFTFYSLLPHNLSMPCGETSSSGPSDVLHTSWLVFSKHLLNYMKRDYQDTLKGSFTKPTSCPHPQPPMEMKLLR